MSNICQATTPATAATKTIATTKINVPSIATIDRLAKSQPSRVSVAVES